jgi:hypothetical protein
MVLVFILLLHFSVNLIYNVIYKIERLKLLLLQKHFVDWHVHGIIVGCISLHFIIKL